MDRLASDDSLPEGKIKSTKSFFGAFSEATNRLSATSKLVGLFSVMIMCLSIGMSVYVVHHREGGGRMNHLMRAQGKELVGENGQIIVTDSLTVDVHDPRSLVELPTSTLQSLDSLVFTIAVPGENSTPPTPKQIILRVASITRYESGKAMIRFRHGGTLRTDLALANPLLNYTEAGGKCRDGCSVVTNAVQARQLLGHRSSRKLWGSVGKWFKATISPPAPAPAPPPAPPAPVLPKMVISEIDASWNLLNIWQVATSKIFTLVLDGFESTDSSTPTVDVLKLDLPWFVSSDMFFFRGELGLQSFYNDAVVTRGGCDDANQKDFLGNVWGHRWEKDETAHQIKSGCPFAAGLPAIDGTDHRRRKGFFVDAIEASLSTAFQYIRLRTNNFFSSFENKMSTFDPQSSSRHTLSFVDETKTLVGDLICWLLVGEDQDGVASEWCGDEESSRALYETAKEHFQAFNSETEGVGAAHASLFRLLRIAWEIPDAKQGIFVRNYQIAAASTLVPRSATLADIYHVINGLSPIADILSLIISELLNGGSLGDGNRLTVAKLKGVVAEEDALSAADYSEWKTLSSESYTMVRESLRSHSIVSIQASHTRAVFVLRDLDAFCAS